MENLFWTLVEPDNGPISAEVGTYFGSHVLPRYARCAVGIARIIEIQNESFSVHTDSIA